MKRLMILTIGAVLALMMTACSTPSDALLSEDSVNQSTSATSSTIQQETLATVQTDVGTQQEDRATAAAPGADSPDDAATEGGGADHAATAQTTQATQMAQATQPSSAQRPATTTRSTTTRSTTTRPSSAARPSTTRSPSTTRPTTPATSAPSAALTSQAEQVAALVNQERAAAGLAPLTLNAELSANALVRAREIISRFDHVRPDGSKFSTAVTISWRTIGENIAYGQETPAAVMRDWMNSSGHRQNILGAGFDKIGVGVVESGGRLYWVQLFAG